MSISRTKTKWMRTAPRGGGGAYTKEEHLHLDGEALERVEGFTYLGLQFS